jgi:hypothetical protein
MQLTNAWDAEKSFVPVISLADYATVNPRLASQHEN